MELSFIKADESDIETLFAFNKELVDAYEDTSALAYDKVLAWIRAKISDNIDSYTCVTLDGCKAAWYRFVVSDGQAELDDLYVRPEFRNRGIGTRIIEKCCHEAECPIFLYVFVKNERAVSLYKRLGFRMAEKVSETRYIMRRPH